jgi:hypothetical protein
LELLASSDQYGPAVVDIGFWDVLSVLWQIIVNRGDLSVLVQYVNPIIQEVEAYQPEGTPMQFEIEGLVNPITGTDYSPAVAEWLNSKWQEGVFTEPSGAWLTPWPEYPYQIAWGKNGILTIRWVKLFPWGAVIVIVALLVAIVLYPVIRDVWAYIRWYFRRVVPPPPPPEECKDKTGLARWWCELSDIERAAVIAGGTMVMTTIGAFAVWYLAQRSIAEAGAPKIFVGGAS